MTHTSLIQFLLLWYRDFRQTKAMVEWITPSTNAVAQWIKPWDSVLGEQGFKSQVEVNARLEPQQLMRG